MEMSDRFQIRRWPANCPPLIGELAVVDTKHKNRIVRTYRDGPEGGAFDRAKADSKEWNANPPPLVMRNRAPEIHKTRNPDGTVTCRVARIEPRFFDESSYADYEYQFSARPGTPAHNSPLPDAAFNGMRG
jgi:hypothetical protein